MKKNCYNIEGNTYINYIYSLLHLLNCANRELTLDSDNIHIYRRLLTRDFVPLLVPDRPYVYLSTDSWKPPSFVRIGGRLWSVLAGGGGGGIIIREWFLNLFEDECFLSNSTAVDGDDELGNDPFLFSISIVDSFSLFEGLGRWWRSWYLCTAAESFLTWLLFLLLEIRCKEDDSVVTCLSRGVSISLDFRAFIDFWESFVGHLRIPFGLLLWFPDWTAKSQSVWAAASSWGQDRAAQNIASIIRLGDERLSNSICENIPPSWTSREPSASAFD